MGGSPYLFVIHHFVDVDGGLGVLTQVPLLLAQEPFPALGAQFWGNTTGENISLLQLLRGPSAGPLTANPE